MKRITVNGPVTLRLNGKRYPFTAGREYVVSDEVAGNGYLAQYILTVSDVKGRSRKKVAAEAEDDGSDS
nr:MAG TPA: hypothetical protein [Caudoviricetes sp.]